MLLSAVALLVSLWWLPWQALRVRPLRQHMVWAASLAVGLFWQLQVEVRELLALHPLLMMLLVMVFGCPLALWVGALGLCVGQLMQLALPLGHLQPISNLAVQYFLNVLVPGLTAVAILKLIERLPIRNLFVYILGGGFIGAMVTVQAMAAASWLYVRLFGPEPLLVIVSDHYYLTLLMMFPEGFINGAVVSTLTVLAPELVKTYDDHRYLDDN